MIAANDQKRLGQSTAPETTTGKSDGPERIGGTAVEVLGRPSRAAKPESPGKSQTDAWNALIGRRGKRYAKCRLKNFQISPDSEVVGRQTRVIERIRGFVADLPKAVDAGQSCIFYGPCGTGKDHLMTAMIRQAILQHSMDVVWLSGVELFDERRDAIRKDLAEKSVLSKYQRCQILAISDPVPPWGPLKEGQAEFLLRIIDERYSQLRPTWITVNIDNRQDAHDRMSSHIWDRLKDNGLALDCNWDSHRKVIK